MARTRPGDSDSGRRLMPRLTECGHAEPGAPEQRPSLGPGTSRAGFVPARGGPCGGPGPVTSHVSPAPGLTRSVPAETVTVTRASDPPAACPGPGPDTDSSPTVQRDSSDS